MRGYSHNEHMNTECLEGIVVDICSRSFLLLSDEGNERFVTCETVKEFTNVLDYVRTNVPPNQIEYADLAISK